MNKLAAALTLVFLSGTTGLIYQVTWQRYLAIFLGSNSMATSLVLGVFFLFMALGYLFLGQWTHRLMKNKVLLYGVIEGLIGLYGLSSPDYFQFLSESMSFTTQSIWTEVASNLLLTSLFIGLPTFLMGGTIPILTEGLVKSFEVSHKTHAWIYSVNTAGAFFGTLLAGFYLIETYGLSLTIWYASVTNLAVAFLAYLLSKVSRTDFVGLQIVETAEEQSLSSLSRYALYAISFLSGFYVFSFENMIIRLAALSVGPSTYTYTMIVGAFILSLALGSSLVTRFKSLQKIEVVFWVQLSLVASMVILYLSVPHWGLAFARLRVLIVPNSINFGIFWFLVTTAFVLLLIVPVGLMGMNLPILFSLLKLRSNHLSQTVGRTYAVNCVGSFLGSLVGGYLMFFVMDGHWVMKLSIILVIATLGLIFILAPKKNWQHILIAFAFLAVVIFLPRWRPDQFIPAKYLVAPAIGQISLKQALEGLTLAPSSKVLYDRFDADSHVAVTQDNQNGLTLIINGKPDAVEKADVLVRSFNALFPMTYVPDVSRVFIVGLGGSRSSGIVTLFDEVKKLDVAEMTKGVIDSRHFFDEHAYNLSQRSHKLKIHHGDAYKVLSSQTEKYGLIISEPSNPWVAGVDKLFSFEFLQRAKNALTSNGYYVQWFPLFGIDEYSAISIFKTFQSIFPWVTVWNSGGRALMILAGNHPLPINETLWKKRFDEQPEPYKDMKVNHHLSLLSRQVLSPLFVQGFSQSTPPLMTLENPFLSYRNGRTFFLQHTTDLMNLLDKMNPSPLPIELVSSRFVYDQLLSTPKEFYHDGLNLFQTLGGFEELKVRLRIKFAQHHPNQKSDAFQIYNKVLETDDLKIETAAELNLWLRRYYQLKRAQLPLSLDKLIIGIQYCKNPDCLTHLQNFLGALDGLAENRLLSRDNRWLNIASIEKLHEELNARLKIN